MASTSVPGIHGWDNRYDPSLPGALGLSLCHGGGLRAPFLFGHGVACDYESHKITSVSCAHLPASSPARYLYPTPFSRETPTADARLILLHGERNRSSFCIGC
jgi:hypothetical protein